MMSEMEAMMDAFHVGFTSKIRRFFQIATRQLPLQAFRTVQLIRMTENLTSYKIRSAMNEERLIMANEKISQMKSASLKSD